MDTMGFNQNQESHWFLVEGMNHIFCFSTWYLLKKCILRLMGDKLFVEEVYTTVNGRQIIPSASEFEVGDNLGWNLSTYQEDHQMRLGSKAQTLVNIVLLDLWPSLVWNLATCRWLRKACNPRGPLLRVQDEILLPQLFNVKLKIVLGGGSQGGE